MGRRGWSGRRARRGRIRRRTRMAAVAATTALLAAACGGGDEAGGSADPSDATASGSEAGSEGDATLAGGSDRDPDNYCEGGGDREVVWAHEQEPPDLHVDDPNNGLSITSWVQQGMWEGLYGITSDIAFFPELLADEAEITENEDGTVTIGYTLRDGLTWSDGEPLTADDVRFTYDVIMEGVDENGEGGVYLIASRQGYDQITDFTVVSDTEFEVTFGSFFSGFKTLFERVFPEHVFGGGGAAAVNEALVGWTTPDGTTLPSSGPLVFDDWQKGVAMTLTRNEDYHGSASPEATNAGTACASGLRINWVTDTDAQINALKAAEADFIFAQPQVAFGERIATDENFAIGTRPGPTFEHWGFNLNNPHLRKPEVREAVALAFDRGEVVRGLYEPIYSDRIPAGGQGNTYWMSNQEPYVDHQEQYAEPQPDAAKEKLREAGYEETDDGFFEHPEDGRLTLRVGTTGGNALRELQQQIILEQMKAAGIEMSIDNVPGADYFNEVPFSEESLACANSGGTEGDCSVWDVTQFAWVGGPWPGGQSASYLSGSGSNPYGFANEGFDARSRECDAETDEAALQDCYNELDTYVTTLEQDPEQGLFMLPITQKPQFYAFTTTGLEVGAVAPDANDAGPLVNFVDFVPAP